MKRMIAKLLNTANRAIEASLSPSYPQATRSVAVANVEAAASIRRPVRLAASGYFTGPDRTPAFHCFTPARKAA